MRLGLVAAAAALISVGAGFALSTYLSQPSDNGIVGKPGPSFHLPDVNGQFQGPTTWPGKAVLVNYWATWCEPCREEMPDLMALRNQFEDRFEVVGIAIDRPDSVVKFAQELAIDYPILIGDGRAMSTMHEFGNPAGALPFSILLDRDYSVAATILGPVDIGSLRSQLERVLEH